MSDRRDFLRGAIATSALLLAHRTSALAAAQRRYAPVKVARNRVIREIVGLRPFRPEGYVVAAERIGTKFLVHNYGHGGGGITLSWGTAAQAVDLVSQAPALPARTRRRFAVLGCGVNGLTTARLLQKRFQDGPGTVTIYAKDLPPETTSNIAAGFWSPTFVYDSESSTRQFREQFRRASRVSNRAFQNLVGREYGVRWIETLELSRSEESLSRELHGGNDLYPQIETHRDPARFFGFPYARTYNTLLIEPPIYLNAMLRDFYIAGGKLVVKEFRSSDELKRLPEHVIFNCTGLGARTLFKDEALIPARGQLEVLLPQPEIDYCYLGNGHMFPRGDGIILGGTFDPDDYSLAPNPEHTKQILAEHEEVMKGAAPS